MEYAGYELFLFHFHQVTHGAHHAHDLGGVFVFHWVVKLLQSESLDGLFLTLGAVDCTAHLSDDNFAHDQKGLSVEHFGDRNASQLRNILSAAQLLESVERRLHHVVWIRRTQ